MAQGPRDASEMVVSQDWSCPVFGVPCLSLETRPRGLLSPQTSVMGIVSCPLSWESTHQSSGCRSQFLLLANRWLDRSNLSRPSCSGCPEATAYCFSGVGRNT